MPTPTYVSLATITLGSTDSEIIFSSIPATYRDLIVVAETKASASGTFPQLRARFNGVTSSIYSQVGAGTWTNSPVASAGSGAELFLFYLNESGAAGFSNFQMQIMDYSATDKHKSLVFRSSGSDYGPLMIAGRFGSTDAVTSITLYREANAFAVGSTFSLYGIAA
jgi:hypothetical protein